MRRYPDFRFPREQWSAGDAATAAIGFCAGLILIVGVISLAGSQMQMMF